jgi:hypothetical protein
VALLCEDDCSYSTGSTLLLDGGYLAGDEEWPKRLMQAWQAQNLSCSEGGEQGARPR